MQFDVSIRSDVVNFAPDIRVGHECLRSGLFVNMVSSFAFVVIKGLSLIKIISARNQDIIMVYEAVIKVDIYGVGLANMKFAFRVIFTRPPFSKWLPTKLSNCQWSPISMKIDI
jgi:hypothetical protein